jgi:hypothetical protein
MKSFCLRVLRHPILHFLLLGAGLFAVDRRARPRTPSASTISITAALRHQLREDLQRSSGRDPSPQEERAALDHYLDEELLYREALSQGLEKGDALIRSRLAQKMELAYEDLEPILEPTDSDLKDLQEGHRDRYHEPARISFRQVFLNPALRPRLALDARRSLARLRRGLPVAGDPPVPSPSLSLRSEQELASLFGPEFARSVFALGVGGWQGPVRSSHGLHLVRLEEVRTARDPVPGEIRSRLVQDYIAEKRQRVRRDALDELRKKYRVEMEPVGAGATTVAQGNR